MALCLANEAHVHLFYQYKSKLDNYHFLQSTEISAKQTNDRKPLFCLFYFKGFHLYETMVTQLGDLFQLIMLLGTDSLYESCQT
jgi:hypothetical protein